MSMVKVTVEVSGKQGFRIRPEGGQAIPRSSGDEKMMTLASIGRDIAAGKASGFTREDWARLWTASAGKSPAGAKPGTPKGEAIEVTLTPAMSAYLAAHPASRRTNANADLDALAGAVNTQSPAAAPVPVAAPSVDITAVLDLLKTALSGAVTAPAKGKVKAS